MTTIELSLIVFAITLLITKSKIFGGKREFVELRYESSKVGGGKPGWVHSWWHAMWTCPMCLGAWIAVPLCYFEASIDWWWATLIVFGLNWFIHCIENFLFQIGHLLESLADKEFTENLKKILSESKKPEEKQV